MNKKWSELRSALLNYVTRHPLTPQNEWDRGVAELVTALLDTDDKLAELTQLQKALNQIEMIVGSDFGFEVECKLAFNPDTLTPRELQLSKALGECYRIAHGNNKDHNCYDSHESWRKE